MTFKESLDEIVKLDGNLDEAYSVLDTEISKNPQLLREVSKFGSSYLKLNQRDSKFINDCAESVLYHHGDQENPKYHNPAHFAQVAMTTLRLSENHPIAFAKNKNLDNEARGLLFGTALIHDLGHPGGNNGKIFEKFEQKSVKLAKEDISLEDYKFNNVERMILHTAHNEHLQEFASNYQNAVISGSKIGILCGILRQADTFVSTAVSSNQSLQSGKKLNNELLEAWIDLPFVHKLDTKEMQASFISSIPQVIISPAGRIAAQQAKENIKDLSTVKQNAKSDILVLPTVTINHTAGINSRGVI